MTLTVTSAGKQDSVTLPITVNAPWRIRVTRAGGSDTVQTTGGHGHRIYVVWTLADGSRTYASSVPISRHPVGVAAVDGTGALATARL